MPRLRVASYNLRNLLSRQDLARLDLPAHSSPPLKRRSHLRALAETIRHGEADIIGLQECGSLETLQWFLEKHHLLEKYPHQILCQGNSLRGIHVGLLSSIAPLEFQSYKDLKFPLDSDHSVPSGPAELTQFSRDLLRVEFAEPKLCIFVAHLKSNRPVPSGAQRQRLAEALAIRRILDKAPESTLLVGDLNDEPKSETLRILQGLENQAHQAHAGRTWPESLQIRPARLSHTWPSSNGVRGSQLDHIVCSPSMAARLTATGIGYIEETSQRASDHLLLWSDFEM